MNFDDLKIPDFKWKPKDADTVDNLGHGIIVGIPGELWETDLHHKLIELGLSDSGQKIEVVCLNDTHISDYKDPTFNLEKAVKNMMAMSIEPIEYPDAKNLKKEEPYYRKFDRKRKK